jgi:hypothetical protein
MIQDSHPTLQCISSRISDPYRSNSLSPGNMVEHPRPLQPSFGAGRGLGGGCFMNHVPQPVHQYTSSKTCDPYRSNLLSQQSGLI